MNWDRLVRVSAPAEKPLALQAAKVHLRLASEGDPVVVGDNDLEIGSHIDAAIAEIDGPNGIGIAMISQTWRLSLDSFSDHAWFAECGFSGHRIARRFPQAIPLPLGPVQTIVSVSYVAADGSTVVLEPSAYKLANGQFPAVLVPAFGTPWPFARHEPDAVQIEFVCGYGDDPVDVPADLIGAIKLLVGHYDTNREAVVGVAARVSPIELPRGVGSIFDRYRCGLFG